MKPAIAIVGMACQYPDARSPVELWENVLAQRRAFRRIPAERLRLEDYFSGDRATPDCTYAQEAAVIEGYEFDRIGFRVAGSTFRAADFAHWLALDVATQALTDAGFAQGEGLPIDRTGAVLGNTLTGELSRANLLRLRWAYVRRVVNAALMQENWTEDQRQSFLATLEVQFKEPFPPIGEETLAGNLSNTIAGRICNYYNLKGGGYTVDGACSSSLLAVATACSSLVNGDLDVALAGGVDVSLDPFEIIGFAKAGALAAEEMRVYDARSAGFIPGEGCGMVVLMREADAIAQGRPIYALIRGWGISSDGNGGMTRPEAEGQLLALQRAYDRAGFDIQTVAYFEGHGTGTAVGDATELQVLSRARRRHPAEIAPAAIGSIKANIGHTKAAAGVAGLIKATMTVQQQILPPTTGCEQPHPELMGDRPVLRRLEQGELRSACTPMRAGVSAMGFGGINTHVVLESVAGDRRTALTSQEQILLSSAQDTELLLLSAKSVEQLQQQVEQIFTFAAQLSRSEITDLAAQLAATLKGGTVRAAIVASTPRELVDRLSTLRGWLAAGITSRLETQMGIFLGAGTTLPNIGLLFPGQGSPFSLDGGLWSRRFNNVKSLYQQTNLPQTGDRSSTQVAQPAIVTAAVAALRILDRFGVTATLAIGHSLGELAALHWAGACDEANLLRLAVVRGQVMTLSSSSTGGMASIQADPSVIEELIEELIVEEFTEQGIGEETEQQAEERIEELVPGDRLIHRRHSPRYSDEHSGGSLSDYTSRHLITTARMTYPAVIAGFNSPCQTVISGEASAIAAIIAKAQTLGLKATQLPVSHAFHSPLVAAAAQPFLDHLKNYNFRSLQRRVISTVTGSALPLDVDIRSLLYRQITAPVRFMEAVNQTVNHAVDPIDLFIEAGPGRVLGGLVRDCTDVPVISLEAGGLSLKGLFAALGAAFALGTPIDHRALFADRFTRPFSLNWQPRFFTNPCERAPLDNPDLSTPAIDPQSEGNEKSISADPHPSRSLGAAKTQPSQLAGKATNPIPETASPGKIVHQLVAERAELPLDAIQNHHRLLSDLHLNSITVGQIVTDAARLLDLLPPAALTQYADATVAEVIQALAELSQTGCAVKGEDSPFPMGIDAWIRPFTVEWVERSLPPCSLAQSLSQTPLESVSGNWQVIAPSDHPLAEVLRQRFSQWQGKGVVVCLPPDPNAAHIQLLLAGARAVLTDQNCDRFILVQHDSSGGAFARTLHLEMPDVKTCVVNVPANCLRAVDWVVAEAAAEPEIGYQEAQYDIDGNRREPVFRVLPSQKTATELPLNANDVLLVTGGGKGITAECAIALARETGVKLILLGRSCPEDDTELAVNLERMTTDGLLFRYVSVDLTDAAAVHARIQQTVQELGDVTAILHGAARNAPQRLSTLNESNFLQTLAPKVDGLQHVLATINPDRLRLLIAFGSIIARTGLPGEADYGLANEWLVRRVEQWQTRHPHCRCLTIEWSIWSDVGMGSRLGSIDVLLRQGITPISTDRGIAMLRHLLAQPAAASSVIVTGRLGALPTLRLEKPDLPLLRFLEQPRVYYPGVELIADATLSTGTDAYLNDHVFHGERVFPAVLGLEAMAQVAMALAGTEQISVFEQVKFDRPIVVPESTPLKIRIAALVNESGKIEATIRSEQTGFQIDHFQTTCCIGGQESKIDQHLHDSLSPNLNPASNKELNLELTDFAVSLSPSRDLYGRLLFHQGRFRRLSRYQQLRAKTCLAEIASGPSCSWFSSYLSNQLVLGDPAARDAAIHALQSCIPHATLLPIAVDKLTASCLVSTAPQFVYARERSHHGDCFVYDLEICDAAGQILERWDGLQLKVIQPRRAEDPWVEALIGPYLERQIQARVPTADLAVIVDCDPNVERRVRSDRAIQQAIGSKETVYRRADGKPEVAGNWQVSVSHAEALTMAIAGKTSVGCDVEPVVARSTAVWQDLLGQERFKLAEVIHQQWEEDYHTAATRVWTAIECLKKAGVIESAPLILSQSATTSPADCHEVWLKSGGFLLLTVDLSVQTFAPKLVFSVLLKQ